MITQLQPAGFSLMLAQLTRALEALLPPPEPARAAYDPVFLPDDVGQTPPTHNGRRRDQ